MNNVYIHNDPRGNRDYDSLYVANVISQGTRLSRAKERVQQMSSAAALYGTNRGSVVGLSEKKSTSLPKVKNAASKTSIRTVSSLQKNLF